MEKEGEKKRKEREGGGEKKKRKKNDALSTFGFEWSLSFEGGFPKVLKEVIPGFRGRKERKQRGSSRVSYRYEECSLIRSQNHTSLIFLRSLLFEECTENF